MKSLKTRSLRTLITKLSKRSNLKKKCRFLRSVWRTWKRFTAWMRRNLTSTRPSWIRGKQLMRINWKVLKQSRTITTKSLPLLKKLTKLNSTNILAKIENWLKSSKKQQKCTKTCRRSSKCSRRVTTKNSKKFGRWMKSKLKQSCQRLSKLIRLFTLSSSIYLGSPHRTNTSKRCSNHKTKTTNRSKAPNHKLNSPKLMLKTLNRRATYLKKCPNTPPSRKSKALTTNSATKK